MLYVYINNLAVVVNYIALLVQILLQMNSLKAPFIMYKDNRDVHLLKHSSYQQIASGEQFLILHIPRPNKVEEKKEQSEK